METTDHRPDSHRPGPRLRLGAYGESLAAAHLRRDGMRVLERNWRCRAGELDIIASDRGVTVFCEVKTRRSLRFGTPMQAIDDAKVARIRRLAAIWQRQRARTPALTDRARTRRLRQAQYDSGRLRSHRRRAGGWPSARALPGPNRAAAPQPRPRTPATTELGPRLRRTVSAVVTALWGGGPAAPTGSRSRRFDAVCVLVDGDTVTIDHRRGVL